jgi:hypothetical protein
MVSAPSIVLVLPIAIWGWQIAAIGRSIAKSCLCSGLPARCGLGGGLHARRRLAAAGGLGGVIVMPCCAATLTLGHHRKSLIAVAAIPGEHDDDDRDRHRTVPRSPKSCSTIAGREAAGQRITTRADLDFARQLPIALSIKHLRPVGDAAASPRRRRAPCRR